MPRYRRRDNRYILPLSHGNDIKIDMLQGSIEYQRHKMPLRMLAAGLRRLRPIFPHHRKVYANTPCCIYSPEARYYALSVSRNEGGLAIEKTGRGSSPPLSLSQYAMGSSMYNHHVVSRHVISASSLWTIG